MGCGDEPGVQIFEWSRGCGRCRSAVRAPARANPACRVSIMRGKARNCGAAAGSPTRFNLGLLVRPSSPSRPRSFSGPIQRVFRSPCACIPIDDLCLVPCTLPVERSFRRPDGAPPMTTPANRHPHWTLPITICLKPHHTLPHRLEVPLLRLRCLSRPPKSVVWKVARLKLVGPPTGQILFWHVSIVGRRKSRYTHACQLTSILVDSTS